MPYHYSTPADAADKYRLPNIQTQHMECPRADDLRSVYANTLASCAARLAGFIPEALTMEKETDKLIRGLTNEGLDDEANECEQAAQEGDAMPELPSGWYYCFALPGCMPDSEWTGPYATEAEALDDARENSGDE